MVSTSALLKSVNVKRTVEVKLTADEFSLANMALALMGSESTLTQAASTATTETLTTAAKQGRWYPLAKRNVSVVVITGKVEGTDFSVDADNGPGISHPDRVDHGGVDRDRGELQLRDDRLQVDRRGQRQRDRGLLEVHRRPRDRARSSSSRSGKSRRRRTGPSGSSPRTTGTSP